MHVYIVLAYCNPFHPHTALLNYCAIMDTLPFYIKSLLLSLFCLIMFNSVRCKSQCNKKDMNTLLHFKQGVTDPSGFLSSWISHHYCCEWKGVKCDNITGRVTGLNLPCLTHTITDLSEQFYYEKKKVDKSHCLTGELNLSLLELEFLSFLNLSNNNFKAIQFNSMGNQKCDESSKSKLLHCGNFSNLLHLDLSYNNDIFIDNLHWLSRLSSLKYLNLGGVLLHKEIDWLHSVTLLPSLTELHLENCQIESIYPSVQYANFTSLQVLNLANNDIVSELPSWLFNLTCHISHIDLSHNKIHGQLPKTLPNLGSIKSLILLDNFLVGPISDWLGQLEQLKELDLSHNSFSGSIPKSLGNLSSLVLLRLVSNKLSGNLPESLGQLLNLEVFSVVYNSLTGIVSEKNFFHLSNLKKLYTGSSSLVYDFDPNWVPPFQLEELMLTNVNERLPSWLFTQSSLKDLSIQDSNASFEPLVKLWKFASQLEFLDLDYNTINGDMSKLLLNSSVTHLCGNNLTGNLPQLTDRVVALDLQSNSLSGSISSLLCHNTTEKSSLMYLKLYDNNLSGELTDCWINWKSLIYIDLSYNNLTGKIPQSMASLYNLLLLDLSGNNFFGEVPLSLKDHQNLWVLNLAENNLSGAIPSLMGQNMKALLLRSNQFSGTIPPQICQLQSLIVIDFASNRLSGPIPNCFHNISAMLSDSFNDNELLISITTASSISFTFYLPMHIKGSALRYADVMCAIDLSSNNLCGTVPSNIYMLIGLQSLNLSHNQLVGSISEEIGNLKQLESVDLSTNHFSGEIPQSMSALHYLSVLNLSFNNLSGKIPSGTQLQGFTNLSYVGNSDLCGPPLTKICPHDQETHNTNSMGEDNDKAQVYSFFYMGLGIGFSVGFLGVLCAIFFNTTFRHAYFTFLYQLHGIILRKWYSIC